MNISISELIVASAPLPIVRTQRRAWSHFERSVRTLNVKWSHPNGIPQKRTLIPF